MTSRPRRDVRGVTLIELLIAMTLLSMLAAGIVIALRVGLSALDKSSSKLTANRRVTSVERILEEELTGIMPVTADCLPSAADGPPTHISFFQGDLEAMRLASAYSLQQGARGFPMILEFQVIPGENGAGVRLVVNEHWYTGPRSTGLFCVGGGPEGARFTPIQIGGGSFVIADKLAYCRFSFREPPRPPLEPRWVTHWILPVLPAAIRIDLAPLSPDPARIHPVSLTIPVRVTRHPLEPYDANY